MDIREDIIFIVNPISGTQGKEAIIQYIESNINRNIFNPRIIKTEYAGHAYDIAAKAVDDKVSFVVAIGGDGRTCAGTFGYGSWNYSMRFRKRVGAPSSYTYGLSESAAGDKQCQCAYD